MEKNCCWVYYSWVIIHNQAVMLVVLDWSNYSTKKELEHAAGIDISDLAANKKILLFWKVKLTN